MRVRPIKIALFTVSLLPLAQLLWKGYNGALGANPVEVITHTTGDWALIFLLLTLAVTPLRKLTRQTSLIRFRRMLGLFAFFYAGLHVTTYVWLDQWFDVHSMIKDIAKRPFITLGFTAFVLILPLAATSTRKMIARLGGRRWQWLHRLIYLSAIAAIVHFTWSMKKDIHRPGDYARVLSALLGYRIVVWVAPAARRFALERRGSAADRVPAD